MKRIAITMGEPGGIGPEVALRAALGAGGSCEPVLVGDAAVFGEAASLIKSPVRLRAVERPGEPEAGTIQVVDTGASGGFRKGSPTADGGRASALAIRKALELALAGEAAAMVTAPISKEALRMAGFPWPGHTEMLAELTATERYAMMLVGGPLRVMLVTIHEALREVPGLVTRESVLKTLRLAARACAMLSLDAPRIAVAGLNPHAGEAGLFGVEEAESIAPAIEAARAEGIPASGPYPADTVFYRASRGEFDMVVAMYHDQGLAPLKLVAFETGVNVTVGLPVIRTSPDHGTAYEIAWKGGADARSMAEALRVALCLRPA
ncbi:MAG: 4-hydroxythreonine-4-phosphate dehydrogenase PdxA [Thermodesulfovibrionales bacterium]